jgi:hypothetical protein
MDPCCQKEYEANKRHNELALALRKHDVVLEKERQRRNLVTFSDNSSGCRCTFDPNSDGIEYPSLTRLRAQRNNITTESTNYQTNMDHVDEKKVESENEGEESSDGEYDYLLDDLEISEKDDELKLIEEKRRIELELEILKQQVAQQHGYGVLRQMHPRRVLRAAGLAPGTRNPPFAVIVHLFDPESIASASLDIHLESIAPKLGRGTKFMSSNGRSVLNMDHSLASRIHPNFQAEKDLPALLVVHQGIVVNICRRLLDLTPDRMSTDEEIVPEVVTDWLRHCNSLVEEAPDIADLCRIRPEEDALINNMMCKEVFSQVQEKRFDCGVAECAKTFFHEHVGISNKEQSGLVVSEALILGQDDEVKS